MEYTESRAIKKQGSLKQEPAAVVAEAVAPVIAVTPIAPVVKPTTPSDDISVDDFLGLGNLILTR